MTFPKTTIAVVKTFEPNPCEEGVVFCKRYPDPFEAIDAAVAGETLRKYSEGDREEWHFLRWAVLSLSYSAFRSLCEEWGDTAPLTSPTTTINIDKNRAIAASCADWLRTWLRGRLSSAT